MNSDKAIFVTGVVGRAMGSGSFKPEEIQNLTDLAAQAWENTFGSFADPVPAPQQPYSPPNGPVGTVPMPTPTLPEGKPFNVWRKDKCLHWNKTMRDATWEWLLEQAKRPDGLQALTALKEMAASDPGDPADKWHKSNVRRIERAKAVLLMVQA